MSGMRQEIVVPQVGESVASGVLATWLKGEGDTVKEGEDLFELETDKATLNVPAPTDGVLEITVEAETEISVGQVVGYVQTAASGGSDGSAGTRTGEAGGNRQAGGSGDAETHLSPAVRRVVSEYGLDVSRIDGTGKGGRITKEDALRAARSQAGPEGRREESGHEERSDEAPSVETASEVAASEVAAARGPEPSEGQPVQTRRKLSTLRKRVAANLVEAKQNAAHLTTFNEVDMSSVVELRKRLRDPFQEQHGVKLGFMSFFVKASQAALKEYPEVNAYLEEEEIAYNHVFNIGVALSTERGLMTPVIRRVEQKSFADIEREVVSFMERAEQKRLMPDELTGGTFTISNGGVFGSMLSTPIPNPPQTAVLGMHAITKRPVAVEDEVVIRPMMYLALSYDHRMIDGREAIGFLNRIKECIEDPARMLLEI